jgi:hypothetical protein
LKSVRSQGLTAAGNTAIRKAAWTAMLTLDGPAAPWSPNGGGCGCSPPLAPGRRLRLRLATTWPWASQLTTAITRLQAFASS